MAVLVFFGPKDNLVQEPNRAQLVGKEPTDRAQQLLERSRGIQDTSRPCSQTPKPGVAETFVAPPSRIVASGISITVPSGPVLGVFKASRGGPSIGICRFLNC